MSLYYQFLRLQIKFFFLRSPDTDYCSTPFTPKVLLEPPQEFLYFFQPPPRRSLTESWLLQDTTWRRRISGMSTSWASPDQEDAGGSEFRVQTAGAPCAGLTAQAHDARAFQTAARRRSRQHCASPVRLSREKREGLSCLATGFPRLPLAKPRSSPSSR